MLVGVIVAALMEHTAEDKIPTGWKNYIQKQLGLCSNAWSSSGGSQGRLDSCTDLKITGFFSFCF